MTLPQIAISYAITTYAASLGVSFAEALELCKTSKSAMDAVMMMALAQADREKLEACSNLLK